MKKPQRGRKVELSGIDIEEITNWFNSNTHAKGIVKCQAIISLYNGNSMQDVCTVLGVTRETVRKWKDKLRQGGVVNLLSVKKAGKRSKINTEKKRKLKAIIKQKPVKYGYTEKKWTGIILKDFLEKNWDIKIGVRAAQIWLKQLR